MSRLLRRPPTGMRAFTTIWVGQVLSLLGTGLTQFAITIWAWEATGSATALALVGFFTFGPTVVLSPIAGALVDRTNRKLVMMASDLAAGVATVVLLLLYLDGRLEIWHLYVAGAFSGAFSAFQFPAYSAAVTMMLRKDDYARASGMLSLAESIAGVVAPALAGVLLGLIGISGIMAIDIVTFVIAIDLLLIAFIPEPKETEAGKAARGSLLRESVYGFRYIVERPGLLGLQTVFFGLNLIATGSLILFAPMVLARTGNDEVAVGIVGSAFGAGGVVGGLLLSAWGGPKRRVHGVLGGMILASLLGTLVIGVGPNVWAWAAGAFVTALFLPIINGSNQAIWQAKVEPDVQGRVFAARRLIAQIAAPAAMLVAGPLADRVFEPAMLPGGGLADRLTLIEAGPGGGMAVMFAISGILGAVVGAGGYLIRAVREVEDVLPDAMPEAQSVSPSRASAVETAPGPPFHGRTPTPSPLGHDEDMESNE